jgi:hypothetical protein
MNMKHPDSAVYSKLHPETKILWINFGNGLPVTADSVSYNRTGGTIIRMEPSEKWG